MKNMPQYGNNPFRPSGPPVCKGFLVGRGVGIVYPTAPEAQENPRYVVGGGFLVVGGGFLVPGKNSI